MLEIISHTMLVAAIRNATVGEHGKPEAVIPLSENSGDVADKKIKKSRSDKLKNQFAAGEDGGRRRRGSGNNNNNQHITVKGEVTDSTPLVVYLGGQVVTTVQRKLLRFSDASK